MRKNRILYILAIIIFLGFSMAYKSRLTTVLLIVALCYPLLALITSAIALIFADAEFEEPRTVHEKAEPFELCMFVRNRSVFCFAPAELVCILPDRESGVMMGKRVYAAVPPFGRCKVMVGCMHRFRGSFSAEINHIAVYDPLRIIRLSKKLHRESTLIFLPRRIPYGELDAIAESRQNTASAAKFRGDRDEFSHVREYRMGDLIQLIHWKLTAKQDDLMMKQFDESADRRVVILCDFDFEADSPAMRQADAIIEASISFAMSCVDSNIEALVDFGSPDVSMISEINDKRSFERFYQLMSVIPSRQNSPNVISLIKKYENRQNSAMIIITCTLTEELIQYADMLAQSYGGTVALIYIYFGAEPELAAQAQECSFAFMSLCGDDDIFGDTEDMLNAQQQEKFT
ncbi:MAG: DUF58 domain-containing protein [Oscillospiraceae bacterium]